MPLKNIGILTSFRWFSYSTRKYITGFSQNKNITGQLFKNNLKHKVIVIWLDENT